MYLKVSNGTRTVHNRTHIIYNCSMLSFYEMDRSIRMLISCIGDCVVWSCVAEVYYLIAPNLVSSRTVLIVNSGLII